MVAALADGVPGEIRPRGQRWTVRLIVLAVVLLVLGPILVAGLPGEIARWHQAAATEKYLNDDFDGALQSLDHALAWSPDDADVLALRGKWKLDRQDYRGSLEDFDRAVQIQPHSSEIFVSRTVALQHLGRHPEAIADWEKLVKLREAASAGRRAEALNGLAYARAVAKTDLDQALQGVEQALELMGDNAAMLDTRGYIQVLRGELEAAKADLEIAVPDVEQQLQKATAKTDYIDRRKFQGQLRKLKQSVAVICYHRALLYDQLGQAEPAAADRRRVRELGFEPTDDLF